MVCERHMNCLQNNVAPWPGRSCLHRLEKHLLCDLGFHNIFEGESGLALFGHKLQCILVTNGEIVESLPSSAALLFNPLTSKCHFQIGIDPVLARYRIQACSFWHQFKTMAFALFCFLSSATDCPWTLTCATNYNFLIVPLQ